MWQDLRFAFRLLRKQPGFTIVAVMALALGLGANAGIFSVVNTVLLRPLPYPQPDRLVAVETRNITGREQAAAASGPDFLDLRTRTRSFASLAAISPVWNLVARSGGRTERLEALFVSAELMGMLGVTPAEGRWFVPAEDRPGAVKVAVLSHVYWQRRFGGDRSVVGRTLELESSLYTIVGVMPARFEYLGPLLGTANEQVDLWLPLAANPLMERGRAVRFLTMAGRLKDGVTEVVARADLASAWMSLVEQCPETNRGFESGLRPLTEETLGRLRPAMMILLAVAGLVLLIACANVANLVLARSLARRREIGVRVSLGASWGRLLRQLIAEGLVLAAAGGAVGLGLGWALLRMLPAISPANLPRSAEIGLDAQTLVYTLAMVMLAAILTGLAPAWQLLRSNVYGALKAGSRTVAGDGHRLRGALVVSQFVLAMVLLAGAGLLVRSFMRLLAVDPGFVTENVVTLSTQIGDLYHTPQQRLGLLRELTAQLEAVPGVRHVGVVSRLPLLGANVGSWLSIEGRNFPPNERPDVEYRIASPGYLKSLGIPLRVGRLFDAADERNPGAVALINEAAARRYWAGEDPVGKRIKLGGGDLSQAPWITIVGVVGDVRHFGLDESARPEVYRPIWHNPLQSPIFVVRSDRAAESMIPALQAVFQRVEPNAPVYNVFAMERLVERSLAPRRFPMLLLGLFALMAAALAAVGIYGVLAQMVAERVPELGVRIAVGARPPDVLVLILKDGMRLAIAGIALGSGGAALLSGFAAPLLYQTSVRDALTFLIVPVVMSMIAGVACALPALRASRLEPARCLRAE